MLDQWELWQDCTFCNGFKKMADGHEDAFFDGYPVLKDCKSLLDKTDNLILIPDIAPLVQDHLLLLTKTHIPSFAALPIEYLGEAELILRRVLMKMDEYHPDSEIIVFEHGVGLIEGQVVQCGTCNRTDHAHLHILPLPKTRDNGVAVILMEQIIKGYSLTPRTANPIPSLSLKPQVGIFPYLLLWSSLDIRKTYLMIQYSLDISIPSQVIRKLLGLESLGLQESDSDLWDWRNLIDLHPREVEKMVRETIQRWCIAR